jgi:hypothetical protein
MKIDFNANDFISKLNGLTDYSIGFIDGIELGKPVFMNNFGESVVESLKDFIDTNARVNPRALHHVYEWYQTGSPASRLFDIDYIVRGNNGLSFSYTFSQSASYSNGSIEPFYNKAQIMENGTPVTIKSKSNGVLSFDDNGTQVFTKKPIVVQNPGGSDVQGSFENTLKTFFNSYFTQAFLKTSGIMDHLQNPSAYKNNIKSGVRGGKAYGEKIGYEWITKGGRIE